MVSRRQLVLRTLGWISFAALAALPLMTCLAGVAMADEYESGEVQIELAPGTSIQAINALYGTTTLDSLPPLYLLGVATGQGETEILDQMEGDPRILEAEYSWKNETPEGSRQMVAAAVGGTITDYLDQHLTERIHLAEVQEHTRGAGVLVAVIDTGVLAGHPALADAIAPGGWDFVDNDGDPADTADGLDEDGDGLIDEGAGHGTMVCGIVHLVAPDARILPIRVLDDEGLGKTFTVAKGIRYAAEHGVQVINLSLGLTSRSWVIAHEIQAAAERGISIVSAAGNLGSQNPQVYPASDSRVLSVAALDSSDVKADFSSYRQSVAVSAPGVGVMSAYYDGGFAIGAGTSFSAPFVSGQCALVLSLMPSLAPEDVYTYVREGVVGIYGIPGNEPYEGELGTGRIDGLATWDALAGIADAQPPLAGVLPRLTIAPNPVVVGMPVSLRWSAPAGALARGTIYDVQGRLVRDLGSLTMITKWDGASQEGTPAPAGVYFVRIRPANAPPVVGRVTIVGN